MLTKLFGAPLISFLSPDAGKWKALKQFNSMTYAVLYDATRGKTVVIRPKGGDYERKEFNGIVTLKGNMYPSDEYLFDLSWTEQVPNADVANNAVFTDGPKKGQKKYVSNSAESFLHSAIVIAEREESDVPFLFQQEIHPVSIEFPCMGGGSYVIIVQVTVDINNPFKTRAVKKFLHKALGGVKEAIFNWASTKTYNEAKQINVDHINSGPVSEITLPDVNGNSKFYLDVLNEKFNRELGFTIPDVSIIEKFTGDASKAIFESENKTLADAQLVPQAEYERDARLRKNEAKGKENQTELEFQTGIITEIKGLMTETLDKHVEIAKAYGQGGNLQYYNAGGTNTPSDPLELLALINKQRGGANATT